MGAFLDKPRTEKWNKSGDGAGLHYGIAAMQGWRIEMEDSHCVRAGDEMPSPWNGWSFFAVFDGHAGSKVAKYSSTHLLDMILNSPEMQTLAKQLPSKSEFDSKQIDSISKAVKTAFLTLDEKMRESSELYGENERSGSTAVCALVSPSHIFMANLGDSRALISRNGLVHFATEDHKPYLPKERDRILNAGGSVMIQRVNGSLAVSRAFGDYEYKNVPGLGPCYQLVSPEPDVHVIERDCSKSGKDEFLLLACDGVFDVMTNHELCDFVRSRLRVTDRLDLTCNQVLDSCLSKGSKDNMSIILVTFAGAPTVCNEAMHKERELEDEIRRRIRSIYFVCDHEEALDADYVLRLLVNETIPGLPPGAGLHAMRPLVESVLESLTGKGPESGSNFGDNGSPQRGRKRFDSSAEEIDSTGATTSPAPTSPTASTSPSPSPSPSPARCLSHLSSTNSDNETPQCAEESTAASSLSH